MMNQVKVAIIIVNWNRPLDTIACVQSIYKSSYKFFEVIVVDNGSSDNSSELIAQQCPQIKIIKSKINLGFGRGNNLGIEYALQNEFDYIWLLNNDTIIHHNALSEMINIAEKDKEVGAVGCVLYDIGQKDQIQTWGGGKIDFILGRSHHYQHSIDAKNLDYLTAASLLLPLYAIKDVGMFDAKFFMYWEDTDLSFRLRSKGWKLLVADKAIIWHKESASLGKKSNKTIKYFNQSAAIFFRKHAKFPLLPILIGNTGRRIKQIGRRWLKFL